MLDSAFPTKVERQLKTHRWTHRDHDISICLSPALAADLASRIVEHRCKRNRSHFNAWRERFEGGAAPSGTILNGLQDFLSPVVGLPNEPKIASDHLEGFVAEHLFYFLWKDAPPSESVVRIEPPSFKATDQGGDSLVVHSTGNGALYFRLWEIKKKTGKGTIHGTVRNAVNQLRDNALEYLARSTYEAEPLVDQRLEELYAKLGTLWSDADVQAEAGVAVATSSAKAPRRCFETFPKQFPAFTTPPRIRGLITTVGDFSRFAEEVRDAIWKGL